MMCSDWLLRSLVLNYRGACRSEGRDMIKNTLCAFVAMATLTACDVAPVGQTPSAPATPASASTPTLSASQAARSFVRVVRTVEPVAERECRARTQGVNCDFHIVVDDRPGQPANAFQTIDRQGRPVVAFTLALIGDARNEDELAFVLGHETAHHIAGHIERQQQNAVAGAVIFSGLATLAGVAIPRISSLKRMRWVRSSRRGQGSTRCAGPNSLPAFPIRATSFLAPIRQTRRGLM